MTEREPPSAAGQTAQPQRRINRISALVLVGLLLVGAGGVYLHLAFCRPIGTGPAGPAVDRTAFAQPWITSFARRIEAVITTIGSRFPGGCQVFLANIYDPTDGAGDVEHAGFPAWRDGLKIIAAYNDVIRRCADKHPNVHLVNFHGAFLGHGIHCAQFWAKHYDSHDPHYWYYSNLEDPNERGYDAIRRLFLIEMAKAAKQLQ